jgi:HSP20 family protein
MTQVPVEIKKSAAPAPVDAITSFRQEMDRLMDRFMGGFGLGSLRRAVGVAPGQQVKSVFEMVVPAVDVTEDAKAFVLTAELPGLAEKNVEVAVSGGMLVLKGEKRQESEEHGKDFHMTERAFGSFERSFALPEGVDADKITAAFGKGVLTVTLPKKPEAAAPVRKIDVKPAG